MVPSISAARESWKETPKCEKDLCSILACLWGWLTIGNRPREWKRLGVLRGRVLFLRFFNSSWASWSISMHSAYLSSNSRNWETQDRRNKNTQKVLPGCYLHSKKSVDVIATENHICAKMLWIVSPQQWVAAGHPSLHPSAESAPHSLRHAGNTAEHEICHVLLCPYCISLYKGHNREKCTASVEF